MTLFWLAGVVATVFLVGTYGHHLGGRSIAHLALEI